MIITGLTGGIGHGKTTFADLLAQQARSSHHFETWELVAEVATGLRDSSPVHPGLDDIAAINVWLYPLAELVSSCTHAETTFADLQITDERLQANPENYQKLFEYLQAVQDNPSLLDQEIDVTSKDAFRPLLQWLGGYLVNRVHSGIWYDEIIRRINYLGSSGYELVTVGGVRYPADAERLRNSGGVILEINRPAMPLQDARDITERERSLIRPDSIIVNNGNLEQLADLARKVYKDLLMRELKSDYQADTALATA